MLTIRQQVIEWVIELAKTDAAYDELESRVEKFNQAQLKEALLECGVIPEAFEQNSSEEKLWAKYCDILLALAFNAIGLEAEVLRVRGNSADVLAKAKTYSIVSDAKAFRLSRTAKNQKDFKIGALDSWRKKNTYACLVGPLTQYPNTESQIYSQAISHKVTLISYTHLLFLIEYGTVGTLEDLWKIAANLTSNADAKRYWAAIDTAVIKLCGKSKKDLGEMKALEVARLKEIGKEGIDFWQGKIAEYNQLSKDQAIKQLIQSEKIESKITTIQKAIA